MPTTARIFVVAAAMSALATSSMAGAPKGFLKKALMGDNSEVALGEMAERDGASAGVRDFGRMLREDHASAKQQALPVARAHGVADTRALAPEASAEKRKLARLKGEAFDREFVDYMVKDHKKDIADFEAQSREGDEATRNLAKEMLPALRRHLQTAQSLSKAQ